MMYVHFRLFVNAVPSVRVANAEEVIVLRSQERGDMAFTLAPVFAANQHIDQGLNPAAI